MFILAQCSVIDGTESVNFDVLLTVHLTTILVINQLEAQNLILQ